MKQRLRILALLAVLAIASSQSFRATPQPAPPGHVEWVGKTLQRMLTIKPGMTRADLLKVFTTEGGISTAQHRRYVSRDCAYFKVDVDFEVRGPSKTQGDENDIILRISQPYLQYMIVD